MDCWILGFEFKKTIDAGFQEKIQTISVRTPRMLRFKKGEYEKNFVDSYDFTFGCISLECRKS